MNISSSIAKTFIELALQAGALKFGSFTLKSGRQSPYFFNAGAFQDGEVLKKVGECYADVLIANKISTAHLFGPAYKGIPLATSTAIALAKYNIKANLTFNRKEAKDHGEGGMLIGATLHGKEVVMVDDVITRGTAFRESKQLIEAHGGILKTVIIGLDRAEKGSGDISTLEEIRQEGITVLSIIHFRDLLEHVVRMDNISLLRDLEAYRDAYGV